MDLLNRDAEGSYLIDGEGGRASFSFKDDIYLIHPHSNLWHISDWQSDLQTFHTLEDLLEHATLEGVPLKEKWSEVKIV